MPKGSGKIVVSAGMNAVECGKCKDGTVFIPITMLDIAMLRNGYTFEVTAKCTLGHSQTIIATAWPLAWGKLEFSRT